MLTPEKDQQIKQYKRFVSNEEPEEVRQVFEGKKIPSMIGSETFIKWVKKTFFSGKRDKEIPESRDLAPDTESIIQAVCRFYAIDAAGLLASKRGTENEPRNVAMYLIRKLRGEPLIKIGADFNLGKHSSVNSAIACIRKRIHSNGKLRKRIEKIIDSLTKSQTEI